MVFKRTIENFVCEHCGAEVIGTGFTNHCPKCAWSKHVDVHPGDRAEPCGGMMKPVALEGSSPVYSIVHVCERCGLQRKNRTAENDEPSVLLLIAQKKADAS
jgi:rubrerythrin